MKFSAKQYNKADSIVAQFTKRAFEICKLFTGNEGNPVCDYSVFYNWLTFGRCQIYDTVHKDVRICFDLHGFSTAGWLYVAFPVKLMNMDDDKIKSEFRIIRFDDGRGNTLNYKIVKRGNSENYL